MTTRRAIFLTCASLFLFHPAFAEPVCKPTYALGTSNYPGARGIPTTNNLLRPTGKSVEAEAQKLIISGQVVDKQCMPVPEATVEIWQRNPFGKWYLAEDVEIVTPNALFAGAGRAVTDGEGNFHFITGFPGVSYTNEKQKNGKSVSSARAPQVNIRIKAAGFKPLDTVLFFDHDRRNASDPVYKKLSASARESLTLTMGQEQGGETLVGSKQLVLSGKTPYRTY